MIDLPSVNFPYPLRELILRSLANPRATPDLALILADALDEQAANLPAGSHFIPTLKEAATSLRDHAPTLAGERRSPEST